MADNEKKKDLQEKIKANLESIMNNMDVSSVPQNQKKNPPVGEFDAPNGEMQRIDHPHSEPMNIHAEKTNMEKEARKVLGSVMKFYVDQKYIKKNEYFAAKKKIDEMALSSIMFSLKFTQLAMIKLLEDIDMGNTHPRNFEAFAQLNNQLMSVVKHQAAYMVTLEEGYKKVRNDQFTIDQEREKEPEKEETITKLDGPVKARGTRGLMQTIQMRITEDAKIVEEGDAEQKPRLTDPHSRPHNPMAKPESEDDKKKKEDLPFDLDEDCF